MTQDADHERVTLPQLAREYTEALRDCAKFMFFVRATSLQKEQIEKLSGLRTRFKAFKAGAVQIGDEYAANGIFHMQCGINAHISVLQVWIYLKSGEYHKAWDALMDAQEYVSVALRADDGHNGMDEFLAHLREIESVVFPGFPRYTSWGAVIRGGVCTVCGKPFNECEHIEGKIYWGKLCVRVQFEVVSMDHSALVEEPEDRRCILTEMWSEDGTVRDYFTWKRKGKIKPGAHGPHGGATCVLFSNRLIDVT